MTTKVWYKSHEGWLGALMVIIGAFALGMMVATVVQTKINTNQINAITHSYQTLIVQKDEVITKLTANNINATQTAVSASNTAVKAADTAVKATDTAVKATDVAVKATQEDANVKPHK